MVVTKYTIKADKVFVFTCADEELTQLSENSFKAWIINHLASQYPDKGAFIITKYEHPVLSAIAVIDINEGQEAVAEEIIIEA